MFEHGKKRENRRKLEKAKKIIALNIPSNSIRSIEDLARLSTEIPIPIGYLSGSQIKWLEYGGMDYFKETKPYIYELLEKMKEIPGIFPVNLSDLALEVRDRIREKAQNGEIDEKWKNIKVTPSEVDTILRFKRDPFFSHGEKTGLVAKTIVEILHQQYEEEKRKLKYEEPEVKVALEVAKRWLEKFLRAQGRESLKQELKG